MCSSGGSQMALSPGAASDTPATGEDLIRAVHSLKDITALHASIEVRSRTSSRRWEHTRHGHAVAAFPHMKGQRLVRAALAVTPQMPCASGFRTAGEHHADPMPACRLQVQPLTPPLLRRVQQDTQEVAERARGEWLQERRVALQQSRHQRGDSVSAC